jgi:hypothetical protein
MASTRRLQTSWLHGCQRYWWRPACWSFRWWM